MSVDLTVKAAKPLSSDEVAAVVAAVPGRALEGAPEAMAGVQSTNSFYAEAKDENGYVWNGRKGKGNSQAFLGPRIT